MNIIVNTLSIKSDQSKQGGVATYLLSLLDGLLNVASSEQITLLCSELNERLFDRCVTGQSNVEKKVLPLRRDRPTLRILFDQVLVPLHCMQYENAVLLNPSSASSLLAPLPEVVVIQAGSVVHSIRRKMTDEAVTTSWLQRFYYDTMLPLTLLRASQVVTVSNHLRQKIVGLYPWSEPKVRTVHEGVDLNRFLNDGERTSSAAAEPPYLLFVSTLYPYKHADQAIRAFSRASEKCDRKDLHLKLAGNDPGTESERLKQIARENGVSGRVKILGAVPHTEMPVLYRQAQALLFPSSVESFGLPVLEAMACGTPVIGSNRMSIPEVIGDAGLVVDPADTEAMTDAVCRVLTDTSLQQRLAKAGKKRARSFTWEQTARGVWQALRDALDDGAT
ncbi:glycosyltransferase family 4 protein [Salinibacter ruber]|uniref:glycosyltransferase family 4 protein n=1 Tax=Salinibacter ruber TaxID=146919 RepID=UPI002072C896|nr:glycosyltransferase family 1 protein [Salinibacter ruber]MCS4114604.1 glycosyltransferase involved in cell wall biosynthesis [Salinibacter ruber]MCS4181763.1 glycosyltransferase involved in cell wall biosynthesis [Salinibacter ruber]